MQVIAFNSSTFVVTKGEIELMNVKANRIYVQTMGNTTNDDDGEPVVTATLNTTKAHITSVRPLPYTECRVAH